MINNHNVFLGFQVFLDNTIYIKHTYLVNTVTIPLSQRATRNTTHSLCNELSPRKSKGLCSPLYNLFSIRQHDQPRPDSSVFL